MMNDQPAKEENRKIRFLRFLVDFTLLSIQQDDLSCEQALQRVEDARQVACRLFPEKEETFDLIYRPRFLRAIEERFGPVDLPLPSSETLALLKKSSRSGCSKRALPSPKRLRAGRQMQVESLRNPVRGR